jgi:hypothetical protein
MPSLQERVMHCIGYYQAATEKGAAAVETLEKQAVDKLAAIPAVVAACVKAGRIEPDQADGFTATLKSASPAQLLGIMAKVAAHRNDAEIQKLGQGIATTQKAGSEKRASVVLGARETQPLDQKTADLFAAFGLPVPTE